MEFDEKDEAVRSVADGLHQLKVSCYLNILLCYNKLKKYDLAIREADKILEMSPLSVQDQVKTYYRRAQAHKAQHDQERALADLQRAHELDGGKDPAVVSEYQAIKRELQEKRDFERRQYAKMFQ